MGKGMAFFPRCFGHPLAKEFWSLLCSSPPSPQQREFKIETWTGQPLSAFVFGMCHVCRQPLLWSLTRNVCFAAKTVCPCERRPVVVQACPCRGEQVCPILGLILGGHCWHKPKSYPFTQTFSAINMTFKSLHDIVSQVVQKSGRENGCYFRSPS